jgi:tape measure domain-containing protein
MALNVGVLTAALTLNIQNFLTSLNTAQAATSRIGTALTQAVGTGAQNGLNGTTASVNRFNNSMKDVRRIVQGILVAQFFYRITTAIQDSIFEVQRFSQEMEVAQVSFERLLGSSNNAKGFISVMQDFAALTPFTTEQTLEMSRRMIAMGFQAESVKDVMTTLTDATSALGGDASKLDRMVLGLGQISTNGKLAGQEIRQLGEAGVPIRRILREELGLTAKQLQNIGKLSIDGETAVTAILRGMKKRYEGMNAIIAETTKGMLTTIKDDLVLIAAQINTSFFNSFSGVVRSLRDGLEMIRKAGREKGLAGIFEIVVPKELQVSLRALIGAFQSLGTSVGIIFKTIGPMFAALASTVVRALAIILPPIAALIQYILRLVQVAATTSPAIKLLGTAILSLLVANAAATSLLFLWRITRLGVICSAVAAAVTTLAGAIRSLFLVMTKNPVTGVILVIAGALLSLALSSKTVGVWLDSLTAKLATLAGFDLGKVLSGSTGDDFTKLQEQYNKQFDDMKKNLKGVGKEASEAGKKVKDSFIASFDEVFQVPDSLLKVGDAALETGDDLAGLADWDVAVPKVEIPEPPAPTEEDKKSGFPWWTLAIAKAPPKPPEPPEPPSSSPLEDGISASSREMVKLLDKIQEGWGKAAITISQSLQEFGKSFETASIPIVAMTNIVSNMIKVFGESTNPILGVSNALKSLPTSVSIALSLAVPNIAPITAALKLIPSIYNVIVSVGLPTAATVAASALSAMSGALKTFASVSVTIGTVLFNGITTKLATIGNWISTNWKTILTATLVAVAGTLLFVFGGEIVVGIGAILTGIVTAITTFFSSTLVASTTGAIAVGAAGLMGALAAGLAGIGLLLNRKGGEIKTSMTNTWNSIKSSASKIWTEMKTDAEPKWNSFKSSWDNMWAGISSKIGPMYTEIKTKVVNVSGMVQSIFETKYDSMKTNWSTMWNNLLPTIGEYYEKIKTKVGNVGSMMSSMFGNIKKGVLSVWDSLWIGIKNIINSIIGSVNGMVTRLNTVKINTPSWAGGYSFGFDLPKIPELANGGIIQKDAIFRAGEGNKKEAVVPLENSSAVKLFAQAIVAELGLSGDRGDRSEGSGSINLTIGTLIGDERSLKELERKLQVIRYSEKQRIGGFA